MNIINFVFQVSVMLKILFQIINATYNILQYDDTGKNYINRIIVSENKTIKLIADSDTFLNSNNFHFNCLDFTQFNTLRYQLEELLKKYNNIFNDFLEEKFSTEQEDDQHTRCNLFLQRRDYKHVMYMLKLIRIGLLNFPSQCDSVIHLNIKEIEDTKKLKFILCECNRTLYTNLELNGSESEREMMFQRIFNDIVKPFQKSILNKTRNLSSKTVWFMELLISCKNFDGANRIFDNLTRLGYSDRNIFSQIEYKIINNVQFLLEFIKEIPNHKKTM